MRRHKLLMLLLLAGTLATCTGCFSPESRLYGKWRGEGLVALGMGELIFNPDGTASVANVVGVQQFEWSVIKTEGEVYTIGWKPEDSGVLVERTLTFVDDDTIDITLINSVGGVRMKRVKEDASQ